MFDPKDIDRIIAAAAADLDEEERKAIAAGSEAQLIYVRVMKKISEPLTRAMAEEMSRNHSPSILVDGATRVAAVFLGSVTLSLTSHIEPPSERTRARQTVLKLIFRGLSQNLISVVGAADVHNLGIVGRANPLKQGGSRQ
jgi:hypothetical protein